MRDAIEETANIRGRTGLIPLILLRPTLVRSLNSLEHHMFEALAVKKDPNFTVTSVKCKHTETQAEMCTFVTRDVLYDDVRTTALEHACQVMRQIY